jgi:DNA polymerase-3 subunit epsilon
MTRSWWLARARPRRRSRAVESREHFEQAAHALSMSPDYRVLRRFVPQPSPSIAGAVEGLLCGAFLDCETTGTNTETDEIIELAIVPFWFSPDGRIVAIEPGQSWLREPSIPIPAEASAVHGITLDDVRGHKIEREAMAVALMRPVLIVAHNAEFDRKMFERCVPGFESASWACSYREVPWREWGYTCSKLGHLLMDALNLFHDAHGALADCYAALHLLASVPSPTEGRNAFAHLLESARQPSYRLSSLNHPSELNGPMKVRGYRWHNGETGRAKEWWREIRSPQWEEEVAWLAERGITPKVTRFNSRDRYSIRTL